MKDGWDLPPDLRFSLSFPAGIKSLQGIMQDNLRENFSIDKEYLRHFFTIEGNLRAVDEMGLLLCRATRSVPTTNGHTIN